MIKKKEQKVLFRTDRRHKNMVFDHQTLKATWIVTLKPSLESEVRNALQNNELAKQIRESSNTTEEDGLLLHNRLVYVPRTVRKKIMEQEHDTPTSGHFEIKKTMKKVTRTY